MAPEGVSVHAARVPLGVYVPGGAIDRPVALDAAASFAEPPMIDDVAELLAAAPLHAIAYGFTSSSYVRGVAGDTALKTRLKSRTRGIPVVITSASAAVALHTLGIQRLALIHPPWFSVGLDHLGADYFRQQGFEVVFNGPAALPADQRAIHPGQLYEWVRTHVPTNADAVFIGGNGLRAIGVIHALEEDLGRPVLTANQVAFWHALRLSGARMTISNYGQIFGYSVASP